MMNKQITLARRPQGLPCAADFAQVESQLRLLQEGEVLIKHTWLGLAPAARLRMDEKASYFPPMAIGDVIYGQAVGQVVASRDPRFGIGDAALSYAGGWQEYSISEASSLIKADLNVAPASVWLGALGTSGLTAYVGLLDLGLPRAGETVVVSAASGAVGSLVGQIAKIKGCRVVGIAGGADKVRHLTESYGFDVGVDYRAADVEAKLRSACPDGLDIYFDNVGGRVRDAVWPLMALGGRIVVCGLISEYNGTFRPGPEWMSVLSKRLSVRGFIMSDHLHRSDAFRADVAQWYRDGKIKVIEHVRDGLGQAVPAFIGMLTGSSLGKTLVRL
jgi:NADPH-dependent curcumin reductase CurA